MQPGTTQTFQLPPQPKGKYHFQADLICDSYIGFDERVEIFLNIHARGSTGRKLIEYKEED